MGTSSRHRARRSRRLPALVLTATALAALVPIAYVLTRPGGPPSATTRTSLVADDETSGAPTVATTTSARPSTAAPSNAPATTVTASDLTSPPSGPSDAPSASDATATLPVDDGPSAPAAVTTSAAQVATVPPPPGPTVTISGHTNWVLFIGAIYRLNGYTSSCSALNGAVKVWGDGGVLLTTVSAEPTVQAHHIATAGSEDWQCDMAYSIAVPRQQRYVVSWDNPTPYANVGCTNSKSRSQDEVLVDAGGPTLQVPVMSYTLLCTG